VADGGGGRGRCQRRQGRGERMHVTKKKEGRGGNGCSGGAGGYVFKVRQRGDGATGL